MYELTLVCRPVIPAPQKLDAEGSQLQSQPRLKNEFKSILDNLARPCLKILKSQKKAGAVVLW